MLRTLPRNWSAPCTTAPRRTQSSQFCAFCGNVEAVAEKRTGGDLRTGANIYGTRVCAYRVVFQKCLGSLSDLVMTQVVRDTPDRMGYTTPLEISTGAPKEDKDGNPFGLLTACSLSRFRANNVSVLTRWSPICGFSFAKNHPTGSVS